MRTKKITAWVLFVAMLSTLMPVAVLAAPVSTQAPYPHIMTDVFSAMTNDITSTPTEPEVEQGSGTDLLLPTPTYTDGITNGTANDTPEVSADPAQEVTDDAGATGVKGTYYKNADENIKYFKRKQLLTFVAKSQSATNNNFIDTTQPTGVSSGAVEIAYLDSAKNPVVLNDEFEVVETGSWDNAWIDVTDKNQIQIVDKTLDGFFADTTLDHSKRTAAQLFATGDMISFMIYNVVTGDFSGFLRVKVKDNNGYITVQDYPFIADGQYPLVEIKTATQKNPVGKDVAETADNTFIAEEDFISYADTEESNKNMSFRYPVLDKAGLEAALNWTDSNYLPEVLWAMNDITVTDIITSDFEVSSGIKEVKYALENISDSKTVSVSDLVGTDEIFFDAAYVNGYSTVDGTDAPIVITEEGYNVLAITIVDNSGLTSTRRFYFYIDKTIPEAEYKIADLSDQVIQLFSEADKVTKYQQGIDMSASKDVKSVAELISGIDTTVNAVYQYRLLAKDDASAGDADKNIPAGYTTTAPADTKHEYGKWLSWTLSSDDAVINEEFDGLIQVRVQDRAGNWSLVDGESVLADNTDATIEISAYKLSDPATEILVKNAAGTSAVENRQTAWVNEPAVLEVTVKDEDLVNAIRSSGLEKGIINVKAELKGDSTGEVVVLPAASAAPLKLVSGTETKLTSDYFVGTELDKELKFLVQYDGTGMADISVSVTDYAENVFDYSSDYKYNARLCVDAVNPYITFRGMTATCDDPESGFDVTYDDSVTGEGLLKSEGTDEYKLRDMPWGPYSQVLEVVVKDDEETSVQSNVKNIKFNTDKAVDLYAFKDSDFVWKKSYDAGSDNVILLSNSEKITNTDNSDFEHMLYDYKFYIVYRGTGIAKVEFYADDEATNVRNYASKQTNPVEYDAMLRVDKIAPEFKNVELVEQSEDVDDVELFAFDGTPVENVTRKQLKLDFDVIDNIGADAEAGLLQSGVNYKGEIPKIDGKEVAIKEVKGSYLDIYSEYYDNRVDEFVDMLENGNTDEDPRIEYLLVPVVDGSKSVGKDIAAVRKYIEDEKLEENWITTWNDDIVIEKEFQGVIVLRTIDRVGNIAYSDVIQVVAESKSPLVKFETVAPTGNAYETLNQYGWAKRDVYFEVKVKDQNENDVDAGIAKVVLNADKDGAMSLNGDTIGKAEKEVSVTGSGEDEDGYISLGFIKATATSSLTVTVYDKTEVYDSSAKADVAESGNKTVATYNVHIDSTAPEVTMDAMDFTVKDNKIILDVAMDKLSDDDSGIAPLWNTDEYNKHDGFEPLYEVGGEGEKDAKGQELLDYYFKSHANVKDYNTIESDQRVREGYIHEEKKDDKFVATQWELPGVQYALIPKNGEITEATVKAWDFENLEGYLTKEDKFNPAGYFEEVGIENKWHNYVPGQVIANADFDGYIVVRIVDKAGNITLLGTSSILDIEFDNDWKNETQFIQVKASEKNGIVTDVEYFGNNDLLTPDGVYRSLTTEALSGEGAFIEIANEGVTNVVIKSKTTINAADPISLSDWEGAMNIGSLNKDWKYQFVDVKIDKQAPEVSFSITNDDVAVEIPADKVITDAVDGAVKIVVHAKDHASNNGVEGMSHISSGIKSVEWCAIPKGSEQEDWREYKESEAIVKDEAFAGTIKVRVTDKAGNVTEESIFIRIDSAKPIISISKSYTDKCSNKPVDVFVTVSESAEFSGVNEVMYYTKDVACEVKDCKDEKHWTEGTEHWTNGTKLPLSGGTISVDKEGITEILVVAKNKAGVKTVAASKVVIHYEDLAVPSLTNVSDKAIKSGDWIFDAQDAAEDIKGAVKVKYLTGETSEKADEERKVWYSLNGGNWTKVDDDNVETDIPEDIIRLTPGANTIRLQARCKDCICESDVVTYVVNYDNGVNPEVEVDYTDFVDKWAKGPVTVNVTAVQNKAKPEIKHISYKLKTNDGEPETKYLSLYDGRITFEKEGRYIIKDMHVTLESGRTFSIAAFEGDGVVVAKIDRTAPVIEDGAFILGETEAEVSDATLFIVQPTNKKIRLKVDEDKITDVAKDSLLYYYALVEKGNNVPNWENLSKDDFAEKVIIDKPFDGTVLLKVSDPAGNETVVSKSIFTEGYKPEIEIVAPSTWQTENFEVKVNVVDNELVSSPIKSVHYKYYSTDMSNKAIENNLKEELEKANSDKADSFDGKLISTGGTIEINEEGKRVLGVIVQDKSGNINYATATVMLDKTAPEYSRMIQLLGVYNEHMIPESDWNIIHNGWTYNHDVSLDGIKDIHSGIKRVDVKFTSEDGSTTETTLHSAQTSSNFSESGKYELTLLDNAGNVKKISFAIDKDLENVINVIGVDNVGKLKIAVTDGDDMLTFYKKENSESKYTKRDNGVTNQIIDGKTGVRYIYGQNDSGKKSNTLYVIVAPSTEYGISLMSLDATPNRYLNINTEGGNVNVKKIDEIFNPGINKNISVGSVVEINEDGVYSITIND